MQRTDQAGAQHQPGTSSLEQPPDGSVQYRHAWNDQIPLTTETRSQYQAFGTGIAADMSAQYLQQEKGSISNAIVDAELTHPVSQDDDTCDAPLTHDIATPRRRIGGRCRKWAVSTQQPADIRRCASCIICGLQFAHGEARLQQWGNRDSNSACVHAQCTNGGVAHDHELHPKLPADQDAVEAVPRHRDCVTQAAADSEILLPLTAGSDQASTAAPADDVKRPFDWTKKS